MTFEEWWKVEGKEMKFYAGEYVEHRGIAKAAWQAATKRAAGIAESYDKTEENWGTWPRARVAKEIAQKIKR